MNLHGIVAPVIGAVNPNRTITLKRSTGFTTQADGIQVPTYSTLTGLAQIQALTSTDLKQVNGMNLQGNFRSVYLYGSWFGVVKAAQIGGDILEFDGRTWLAVIAAENWPDWSRVIVNEQED